MRSLGDDAAIGGASSGDGLLDAAERARFDEVAGRKSEARRKAIDALLEEAAGRGSRMDRAFWSMVHDFEHAPETTNRRQLEECGFTVRPSAEVPDDELRRELDRLIAALAQLRVYLLGTNHLDDRALYERLAGPILDEVVRDVPAAQGVEEWIDLRMELSSEEFERVDEAADSFFDRDATLPRP
jgi:hypothetical protein